MRPGAKLVRLFWREPGGHYHFAARPFELQPGEAKQVIHRDGQIYPVRFPAIITTIGTIWACENFTEENGGTRIVPGSHRWDHSREPRDDEIINAVMPA